MTLTLQQLQKPKDNGKGIKNRDPKFKAADLSCIKAIAQAAINVELFTIPLYMTSMYSIHGMHEINSKGSDFYTGRLWPGAAPSRNPSPPSNEKAFNLIFKVFIEEMLHLQLASNMATLIGIKPDFNSPLLQDKEFGWICYNSTTIPHILDFQDCLGEDKDIRVKLDTMNADQVKLFIAIEQTAEMATEHIDPDKLSKYFQQGPFDWWKEEYTEVNLPLFGSIGWMYVTLWDYLEIEYTDGTTMINIIRSSNHNPVQQDQFNIETKGHPMKEYPGFNATLDPDEDMRVQLMNAINAITDQGEGQGIAKFIQQRWNVRMPLKAVSEQFQPSPEALKKDYVGYDDKGKPTEISGQAQARISSIKMDHFEVFSEVKKIIGQDDYMTWDMWHKNPANKWTAEMLNPTGVKSQYNIPDAASVAGALNELKEKDADKNYVTLSKAAVGTIKGITTQLNTYWQNPQGQFPSPAMYGSGDRVSICWAVTGKFPDLSMGIAKPPAGQLNHSCQGMNLDKAPVDTDTCAAVEIYHSCKGSNDCKTEGGCGFVQNSTGGTNCSQSLQAGAKVEGGCGLPLMSAPANNACISLGGCAVPISASQLFPMPGKGGSLVMQLFNFGDAPKFPFTELSQMRYDIGENVYDVAWRAYTTTMAARFPGQPAPKQPPVSALRLAFPPST